MKERFLTASAVMLIITRGGSDGEEILLQKRCGTGYRDGFYDLAVAGHVEKDEPLSAAMIREAKEEIGIELTPDELKFVCLRHKRSGGEVYFNSYFKLKALSGTPKIMEKEKCSALEWHPICRLPENIVEDRPLAVECYLSGDRFKEYGW